MRTVAVYAWARAAVTPPVDHHRPALRVALGLALPGIALLVAGHPDLTVYAVFGATAGMYGRTESRRRRLVHQGQAAAILVLGVLIGVTVAGTHAAPWVLVLCATLFAAAVSVTTDHLGLKPEGPFFGLFALGAVATVPAGGVSPVVAVSICAATALLAMVLGYLDACPASDLAPESPVRPPRWRPIMVHALRYAAAVGVAGAGGVMLGVDHANWAMAAAAGPLAAADMTGRVKRGIHRVLGTFVGLGVAALLLAPHPNAYLLAICVMALLFPTELFMSHHHGVALGFFTPMIMLMTDLAAPAAPLTLLFARGIDTLIGVGAAVAVAVTIQWPRQPLR